MVVWSCWQLVSYSRYLALLVVDHYDASATWSHDQRVLAAQAVVLRTWLLAWSGLGLWGWWGLVAAAGLPVWPVMLCCPSLLLDAWWALGVLGVQRRLNRYDGHRCVVWWHTLGFCG